MTGKRNIKPRFATGIILLFRRPFTGANLSNWNFADRRDGVIIKDMWPQIKSYLVYFLTGGVFTVVIVALEESGLRLLSGFAAFMPVFTLVVYLFIGESRGGTAVSQHAWFVLVGTIVAWVPYMAIVAYLAPRVGIRLAIGAGLAGFFILAAAYLAVVYHYRLFGET